MSLSAARYQTLGRSRTTPEREREPERVAAEDPLRPRVLRLLAPPSPPRGAPCGRPGARRTAGRGPWPPRRRAPARRGRRRCRSRGRRVGRCRRSPSRVPSITFRRTKPTTMLVAIPPIRNAASSRTGCGRVRTISHDREQGRVEGGREGQDEQLAVYLALRAIRSRPPARASGVGRACRDSRARAAPAALRRRRR